MLIHEWLENQANTKGSLPAVQFGDQTSIDFATLNGTVNRYVNYLLNAGVKFGSKVCVALPRTSIDRIIVLFVLAKLGAVYIPYEPGERNCPIARLNTIIMTAKPEYLIHSWETLSKEVTRTESFSELCLDEKTKTQIGTFSDKLPSSLKKVNANTHFYTVFTSGTRQAKGVEINHGGMDYWAEFQLGLLKLNSNSRVIDKVSANVDAHIWQVLMAVSAGACLYIVDSETRQNVEALKDYLTKNQITDITLTPPELRELKNYLHELKCLKNIYTTGAKCTLEIIKACEQAQITLWDCYGPTELTFGLSVTPLVATVLNNNRAPINVPSKSEIKLALVDEDNQKIAGDNTEGRLAIHSPYVMRGYTNNSEKTKESFTNIDGEQYFLTDDIFTCQDGKYYFIRRTGDAIKIKGQYIDTTEVEQIIRESEDKDVAVVAIDRDDEKNEAHFDPFLVAYISTKESISDFSGLKKAIETILGPTAVPLFFNCTDKLPTASLGKVDKNQLKQLAKSHHLNGSYLRIQNRIGLNPLHTQKENAVSQTWSKVLGIEGEIEQNFEFPELGGTSMNICTIVRELQTLFEVSIPLVDLPLSYLTISMLAGVIQKMQWKKIPESCLLALANTENKAEGALFFLPPITGVANTYVELASKLQSLNLPIYSLQMRSLADEKDLCYDLGAIADDFANAINQKQPEGFIYLAGWSFGATLAWIICAKLQEKGRVVHLGLIDGMSPTVFQNMSQSEYAESLLILVTKLIQIYSSELMMNTLPTQEELEKLEKQQQIETVFNAISASKNEIKNIFATTKANLWMILDCKPQKLKGNSPTVYACQETKDKALTLHHELLGWGEYETPVLSSPTKFQGGHFEVLNSVEFEKALRDDLSNIIENSKKTNTLPQEYVTPQQLHEFEQRMLQMMEQQKNSSNSSTSYKPN